MNFFDNYCNYRRCKHKIRILLTLAAFIVYLCKRYPNDVIPVLILISILVVIALAIKLIWKQYSYVNSIYLVPKQFIYNQNTIRNQNCIIKFIPNTSIYVTDNTATRQMRDIRTFTLTKKELKNINRCWNDICQFFSENTYFDTIYSFIQQEYNPHINVVLIKADNSKIVPKNTPKKPQIQPPQTDIVNIEKVPVDNFNKNVPNVNQNNENQRTIDIANDEVFYDIEDLIKKKNTAKNQNNIKQQNKKLNVNKASAEEISQLPGINIVTAKRIVDYRNKKGNFNSIDSFIEICGLKEYFVAQIKDLISIEQGNDNNSNNDGRIVDL